MKKHRLSFLVEGFKNIKQTGSIAPSSRFLIKKLLSQIPTDAKVVIELGAGEGCVTQKLLKHVKKDCKIISFEINKDLVKKMPKTQNLKVIVDDVLKLSKYLKDHKITKVDAVISSLPLANFPKELSTKLLEQIKKSMHKDSVYSQYQYSLQMHKDLKNHFHVKLQFTPFNIPPAFVYHSRLK